MPVPQYHRFPSSLPSHPALLLGPARGSGGYLTAGPMPIWPQSPSGYRPYCPNHAVREQARAIFVSKNAQLWLVRSITDAAVRRGERSSNPLGYSGNLAVTAETARYYEKRALLAERSRAMLRKCWTKPYSASRLSPSLPRVYVNGPPGARINRHYRVATDRGQFLSALHPSPPFSTSDEVAEVRPNVWPIGAVGRGKWEGPR